MVDTNNTIFVKNTGNTSSGAYDAMLNTSWTPASIIPEEVSRYESAILAAIIVGVLLAVLLLFAMAIFIDCRHQKLDAANSKPKRVTPKKSRIPVFIANASVNSDALAFANQMCDENSVTSAPSGRENC